MDRIPDPKWHQRISFLKSGLRILAGACLIAGQAHGQLWQAGVLLILAELLGIVEELV